MRRAALPGETRSVSTLRLLRRRPVRYRDRDRARRTPAGVLLAALGTSAGIWFADVVIYGAVARGFDLDVSLAATLLLVGAGNLALAVPGAAAGLGSFELVTLAGAHEGVPASWVQ
jgi:uncharacterized membrane protein YbhN (UPF0104 family)